MPWDFIANIGQQQNIGQDKFYWPSGPYTSSQLVRNYTVSHNYGNPYEKWDV